MAIARWHAQGRACCHGGKRFKDRRSRFSSIIRDDSYSAGILFVPTEIEVKPVVSPRTQATPNVPFLKAGVNYTGPGHWIPARIVQPSELLRPTQILCIPGWAAPEQTDSARNITAARCNCGSVLPGFDNTRHPGDDGDVRAARPEDIEYVAAWLGYRFHEPRASTLDGPRSG